MFSPQLVATPSQTLRQGQGDIRIQPPRARAWTFAATAAVLLVLACGPASSPSAGTDAPSGPKQGGTLRVRSTTDPSDWDLSYTGKNTPNGYAMLFAYNSLLGYKAGPDVPYNDGILEPKLAERWEVSPDARSFGVGMYSQVSYYFWHPHLKNYAPNWNISSWAIVNSWLER